METITAKEFYSWMNAITIFIFVLSLLVMEDPDILGYIYMLVVLVTSFYFTFKNIKADKQPSGDTQSSK